MGRNCDLGDCGLGEKTVVLEKKSKDTPMRCRRRNEHDMTDKKSLSHSLRSR
jgi:hypothetical protein